MQPNQGHGFTLVELLVVIAIIVILLALMIGGLEQALKASERAACAAHQQNIAKQLYMYAQDYKRYMVPRNAANSEACEYWEGNTNKAQWVEATILTRLVGLGFLTYYEYLPKTELVKLGHCPSLDTTGSAWNNGLMPYQTMNWAAAQGYPAGRGLDWWTRSKDENVNTGSIVGSYHYRGVSYEDTLQGAIRTSKAGSSFVLLSDTLDVDYGVGFHHQIGYNRAFADGSAGFFQDKPYLLAGETVAKSNVERIPGQTGVGGKYPYPTDNPATTAATDEINGGRANNNNNRNTNQAWGDEAIFNFISIDRPGFRF